MSAIVALHHMASAVVVRTLLDYNDHHSLECKDKAQDLIAKLSTNLYTAVSKDLLELFVESYPQQLPAFLLPVLAPPHLRVLNLKHCCLIEEDSQMEFKNLKETLRNCSKLQSLVLDGCNLVLPLLLCDVITQNASQLVSISVEECPGVSNEFVQKLLRGLPNLSHLNISVCPAVTDIVFALTETQGLLEERAETHDKDSWGCNLSSVDLSGNQQLTSTCIRHLTELCGPKLRHLNVAATRMDCTILWFLSGYSLSTAVQLAAEANKASLDEGSPDGETLCQLISEFRLLQERLKSLQEEECQRQEEVKEIEGQEMEGEGGKMDEDNVVVEVEDGKEERKGQEWMGEGGSDFRNDGTEDVDLQMGLYVNDLIENSRQKLQTEGDSQDPASSSCQALRREDDATLSPQGKAGKQCLQCKKLQETSYKSKGRCVSELKDVADELDIWNSRDKNATFTSSSEGTRIQGERCSCGGALSSETSSETLPESSVSQGTISRSHNQESESSCERTCCEIPKGSSCHSSLDQPISRLCKLTQADLASESQCKVLHSEASTNQTADPSASVAYSRSNDSVSNANPLTNVCKLSSASSANESDSKISTNEPSGEKTAPVCPWRRLYTPCITSLDMSIIDFDATLVVTCLKEFFMANTELRMLTVCWKELSDSMLEIIAMGGTELRSLCLIDCSGLTSLGVAHLLSKCRNLQQLDLQGVCYISDTALIPTLMRGNSCNLQSLKLSETNISDSTLTRIAKYLGEKITTLEISWCEEISDMGLTEIASHCTSLETLTLRQCRMSADTLMSLAWNCNRLSSLNMSGVENLTDGVAQAMAPSLRHLKKLDVSWNSDLTDAAISSVMSCCPLIVELYLMGLKRITEKPLMPIISELARWQRCKKLIKLKMKERTLLQRLGEEHLSSDEEYEDLFSPVRSTSYAPCLRTLELQYCDRVNDDLLAELVAICVGTLSIIDYYGIHIKAKLLRRDVSDA
ncbi:uncharacterized protein LOC119729581 [Patiria miniata]|uniref:F-box/LRR-repeat protein 15-like leucin rich repeat domain-containing protein n=1 Tax=Patiria miniata TaxID=46514 RepID=A0A914A423_PATMI|nr:uncharacterized protein LOC119729581 [Patiria miniata]XP_038058125.1 uncharacterized protein LOC119729581 [Patiria miniata]XP_038058126.1 uncharacterized protein LOC119729581 [Patiria miniata]